MDDEYDNDFNGYGTAQHPDKDKQNQIWVNIGCEFGEVAQLTMGIGEPNEDGFYKDYVVFGMSKSHDIIEVIAMMNNALDMLKEYNEEFDIEPILPEEQS